jgi:hypothetical protein
MGVDSGEVEREAARRRSRGHHLVQDASELNEDGVIVPKGGRRSYPPMGALSLVSELAQVRPGHPAGAVSFVRRWGLLGTQPWPGQEWPPDTTNAASFALGDPVVWLWAHANGVRVALELSQNIRRGDLAATERYLSSLAISTAAAGAVFDVNEHLKYGETWHATQLASALFEKALNADQAVRSDLRDVYASTALVAGRRREVVIIRPHPAWTIDPLSAAWSIIEGIVNPHMSGTAKRLMRFQREGGVLGEPDACEEDVEVAWDSLLSVVYALLLDVVTGARIRDCENCGLPFIQTDARQRFCPGEGRSASRCATRFRQREYQRRRRGEEQGR